MQDRMEEVQLRDLLEPITRAEKVVAGRQYRILGEKWYAKGLYVKSIKDGIQVKAKNLYLVQEGDFIYNRLFAWKGSFAIVPMELDGCYVSNEYLGFKINERKIHPNYVMLFFERRQIWNKALRLSKGVSSISRNRLGIERFLSMKISLPPIEEQKAVVGKIENLRKKILEIKQEKTNVSVPALRQAILKEAVSGKLVPQDPKDEPASELLRKVKAEKERLFREGKIREKNKLSPISPEEIPVIAPEGWVFARLDSVATFITKGTTPTSYGFNYLDEGINFIKVEDIYNGKIFPNKISKFISEEANAFLGRSQLQENDILFSIAGSIGKTCLVEKKDLPANTNQALAIIRGYSSVFDKNFLKICLDSVVSLRTRDKARGGAMNNISLLDVRNMILPIPPFNEQIHISQKVDQLMKLCDELEQKAKENEKDLGYLMETVLKEAFAF